MLRIENLDVFHGDAQALDDVTLEIDEGAIVAIVGANGAGKTSLIRTIAGMHRPARGRILFRGTDIAGWPSFRVCDLGIGQVAEGRQVFPTLSVAENLDMGALLPRARGSRAKNLDRVFALVSGPERTRGAGGRHAVRRRTADARHRPLPDGRTRSGDVRRAVARPRAGRRADRAADDPRSQSRGADLRAGRAECRGLAQARGRRPMCWRTAASRCPAPANSCWPTIASGRPISACSSVSTKPVSKFASSR